jgi:DNA repair photolyase
VAGALRIFEQHSRSILSPVSGFLRQAGFTHSLTPARNCTFGCTYCYVPTMRMYGGLRPEDWKAWGRFTTFKANAADLLAGELRPDQIIYCSPLVDPYQPAEAEMGVMPRLLERLIERPPAVFVIQTRGPAIVRDLALLRALAPRTRLRVSVSITTDDDRVRRVFEPHCASIEERVAVLGELNSAGIMTYATLAPLLPSNPERLIRLAAAASPHDLIADPLHIRAGKPHGATTRPEAFRVAAVHHWQQWFEADFQAALVEECRVAAARLGRNFAVGAEAFAWLARRN